MRRFTGKPSRDSRRSTQFGIPMLFVFTAIIAALVAGQAYSFALHFYVVGLLAGLADWGASVLTKPIPPAPGFVRPVPQGHWRYSRRTTLSTAPVAIAIIYTTFFVSWHVYGYMTLLVSDFFSFYGLKNEVGLSIRMVEHCINAAMLTYLVVYLIGSLFQPNVRATDRIPLLFAISIVVKMFWAIA